MSCNRNDNSINEIIGENISKIHFTKRSRFHRHLHFKCNCVGLYVLAPFKDRCKGVSEQWLGKTVGIPAGPLSSWYIATYLITSACEISTKPYLDHTANRKSCLIRHGQSGNYQARVTVLGCGYTWKLCTIWGPNKHGKSWQTTFWNNIDDYYGAWPVNLIETRPLSLAMRVSNTFANIHLYPVCRFYIYSPGFLYHIYVKT